MDKFFELKSCLINAGLKLAGPLETQGFFLNEKLSIYRFRANKQL